MVYPVYSKDYDMTFLMEEKIISTGPTDGEVSLEVIGFYLGKPDGEKIDEYYGKKYYTVDYDKRNMKPRF